MSNTIETILTDDGIQIELFPDMDGYASEPRGDCEGTSDGPTWLIAIRHGWYGKMTEYDNNALSLLDYTLQNTNGDILDAHGESYYDGVQDMTSDDIIERMEKLGHQCREFSTRSQNYLIFALRKDMLKALGSKRMTKATRERAESYLDGQIEEFRQWADGEVYGYRITRFTVDDPDGGELDECWGFIGRDNALAQAFEAASPYTTDAATLTLPPYNEYARYYGPGMVPAKEVAA